jgi:hypothetical protein
VTSAMIGEAPVVRVEVSLGGAVLVVLVERQLLMASRDPAGFLAGEVSRALGSQDFARLVYDQLLAISPPP